ncbi:MAG: lysylphosphatidylglycerol synthase transmembrane domain-containing protein [Myxococcota bacterium]
MTERETPSDAPPPAAQDAMARFRRWAAIAVALAVLMYVAYGLWTGLSATGAELARFNWPLYLPVLALTGVNYGLRYVKWAYLLDLLGVRVPRRANAWIFASGLAMVISPGKAGELVKPYLVNVVTGAPMMRTVPALFVERGSDGLAVVMLAAVGVSTYYSEATSLIWITLGVCAAMVVALSIRPLMLGILGLLSKVPGLGRVGDRLLEMYEATYVCLRPVPLAITMVVSLVAWLAECVGYWLIFHGMNVEASLDGATFLYAFATVFGAPSPGGMGMADAALVEGASKVIPGITGPQAVAASILVRIATLWFGVLVGAVALLRMERVIADSKES